MFMCLFSPGGCPQFPCGGKQWIHTGDPVEIVRLHTEGRGEGGLLWYRQRADFPLREKGGQALRIQEASVPAKWGPTHMGSDGLNRILIG